MGTVVKRGNSFRAMVRKTGHDPVYKTFDNAKDARRWVSQVEREIEESVVTNPRILISDLIDEYVKKIAPKRKMAESHLGHDIPSIRKAFKDMRMADLQGRGLTDWVLEQKGASVTASWHVARLFGVLRQAEAHWDIVVPWKDMKLCRKQMYELGYLVDPKERDRRVSDEELAAIKLKLSKRAITPLADTLDFCMLSAMRIGEVCRIEWADLDEKARTVVIRDRKHPTKKFGNHQVVPLLNGSFEILLRQPRVDDRIFPRCPRYMSRIFHTAAVEAGVKDVVLHDLRHEGISRLFELGFSIPEVALVSGHRNWRDLRRYTNLKPQMLVEKEQRLLAA